uniref:28S ribosomal protein S9, mitochondrial n=1 Tax=Globodera rostochiensis TaxID=31243 RepID=A0A914HJH9_GLORO
MWCFRIGSVWPNLSGPCLSVRMPPSARVASLSNGAGLDTRQPQMGQPILDLSPTTRERQRRERLLSISDAMKLYLEANREKMAMLEKEKRLYEQGKRHLANIMGFDPETINAEQITQCVRYLFPSGLFDEKARPVMKPPEEILPKIIKIDVDASGAPKHTLFFTARPNFYSLLTDINKRTQKLVIEYDRHQLRMNSGEHLRVNDLLDSEEVPRRLKVLGTQWLTKEQLHKRLLETVTDDEYASLVMALEYMVQLPNAEKEAEFLMSMRFGIGASEQIRIFNAKIPKVTENNGRKECWSICKVRTTTAKIVVRGGGTGLYSVNGHDYCEFRSLLARETLLAPLIVAGKLGQVDVEAQVLDGPGGFSVIPRVVRQGAALGLAALFPETTEKLRVAGLLSTDPRRRERSKVNQPGARAKWIWKAR